MEPKNGGLEDDVPFQALLFSGSMLVFGGVGEFQSTIKSRKGPAISINRTCAIYTVTSSILN